MGTTCTFHFIFPSFLIFPFRLVVETIRCYLPSYQFRPNPFRPFSPKHEVVHPPPIPWRALPICLGVATCFIYSFRPSLRLPDKKRAKGTESAGCTRGQRFHERW